MSGRRCTTCKRLCIRHHGPTGAVCTLKSMTDAEVQEEIEATQLEGEKLDFAGELSVSDRKLDNISSELSKLVIIVGSLSDRVKSNESRIQSGGVGVQSNRTGEEGRAGGAVNRDTPPPIPPRTPLRAGIGSQSGAPAVPSTASLARDVELSKLLDQYNANESAGELLRVQDRVNSSVGSQSAQGEPKVKKAYQIPDFITSCDGLGTEEEDFELLATKGRSFKLQGQKKKPEVKDVSIAQWLSANLVILELLLPTLSQREVLDYYSYTRQIGDFLQIYTLGTVFQLDSDHHKDVARGERRWNEISSHYVHFYLSQSRLRGSGGNAGSSSGTSSDRPPNGKKNKSRFNHPCARFNTREGCSNENCKFKPICSYQGCRGNHPLYEHPGKQSAGDSFRKGNAGSEGGS
jgi:hypothetical protein